MEWFKSLLQQTLFSTSFIFETRIQSAEPTDEIVQRGIRNLGWFERGTLQKPKPIEKSDSPIAKPIGEW
jgi:hypothetical protein